MASGQTAGTQNPQELMASNLCKELVKELDVQPTARDGRWDCDAFVPSSWLVFQEDGTDAFSYRGLT